MRLVAFIVRIGIPAKKRKVGAKDTHNRCESLRSHAVTHMHGGGGSCGGCCVGVVAIWWGPAAGGGGGYLLRGRR